MLQILVKDAEIDQAKNKLQEIAHSFDQTIDKRKTHLTEIKKTEGELRKLENDLNDRSARQRQIKSQLEERQGAMQQTDKQIETCKRMVEQKSALLAQYQQELANAQSRAKQ